jgi:hypothetical protein
VRSMSVEEVYCTGAPGKLPMVSSSRSAVPAFPADYLGCRPTVALPAFSPQEFEGSRMRVVLATAAKLESEQVNRKPNPEDATRLTS